MSSFDCVGGRVGEHESNNQVPHLCRSLGEGGGVPGAEQHPQQDREGRPPHLPGLLLPARTHLHSSVRREERGREEGEKEGKMEGRRREGESTIRREEKAEGVG